MEQQINEQLGILLKICTRRKSNKRDSAIIEQCFQLEPYLPIVQELYPPMADTIRNVLQEVTKERETHGI